MRGGLISCVLFFALATSALADGIRAFTPGDVLRGKFVQERFLQGFAAPLKTEGTFALAPDVGLIWRAEKPFAVTTLMTQDGLAQQSDGATTLNLPASRAPFLAGLYDMLSGALAGNWQGLEEDFTVAKSGSNSAWSLQLTPKKASSDSMPIAEIKVTGGAFVDRVEIVKQGGDHDVLTFLGQAVSQTPLGADELDLLKAIGRP